jgi:hypothetical protein
MLGRFQEEMIHFSFYLADVKPWMRMVLQSYYEAVEVLAMMLWRVLVFSRRCLAALMLSVEPYAGLGGSMI